MSLIGYALRMAKKYYKPATYDHAIRVANYVAENKIMPEEKMDDCIALAIMHDLLEDTEFDISSFPMDYNLKDCLEILTKDAESTYEEYIKHIKDDYPYHPEAYWVKLADIKDHLCQTETLTDKLKEKYIAVMPYLL